MGSRLVIAPIAVGALALLGSAALAGGPLDDLRTALDKTSQARSARIALTQTVRTKDRVLTSGAGGALSAGDSDMRVEGERGTTRRVSVGTAVYERTPDEPGQPWRKTSRPAPAQSNAFGSTTLPDGTAPGDPRLYGAVTYQGWEALPQGGCRKLVVELDMSAVATALKLSAGDAARLAQLRGTLTVWIADADGRVARNTLALTTPSGDSVETTIDLTDLDAPLVIGAP